MNPVPPMRREAGFSLIEMLVALVILSLSLGVLYQATAGATRNVRLDERYTYAVQIAQSLLAEHPYAPPQGLAESGVMGDFLWRLDSLPYTASLPSDAEDLDPGILPVLQQLTVEVRWEGADARELRLTTLVPEFEPELFQESANAF